MGPKRKKAVAVSAPVAPKPSTRMHTRSQSKQTGNFTKSDEPETKLEAKLTVRFAEEETPPLELTSELATPSKSMAPPRISNSPRSHAAGVKSPFYLKSILRATRRLSQAPRPSIDEGTTSGVYNRRSSIYAPNRRSSIFGCDRRSIMFQRAKLDRPRPSFIRVPRIRFRDSGVQVCDITPLPDKPPGKIRMPDSPKCEPTKDTKTDASMNGKMNKTTAPKKISEKMVAQEKVGQKKIGEKKVGEKKAGKSKPLEQKLSEIICTKPPLRFNFMPDTQVLNAELLWKHVNGTYPRSFPGLEILTTYQTIMEKSAQSGDHQTLPWVQFYKPRSSKEFIGNEETVDLVKSWLEKWKTKLQRLSLLNSKARKSKKSKDEDEDGDYVPEDMDFKAGLSNLAFIQGPSGVGKTCLIYALAEELGFKVIEINCSSLRNQKQILSIAEAAQTHRINPLMLAPAKKYRRKPIAAPKIQEPKGIQKYFTSTPKRAGRKTPPMIPPAEIDVVTIEDDEPGHSRTEHNNNTAKRPMSLFLFDDVDIILDADDGFWRGLRELCEIALVPIVMTCKDFDASYCQLGDVRIEEFKLDPIDKDAPALYFRLLLLSRRIILENDEEFRQFCGSFNGNLRSCLNDIEFWLGGTNKTSTKTSKSGRRAKTPPQQGQHTTMKRESDDFDTLAYEMRWLQDQYSSSSNIKWPSRCLDGIKDCSTTKRSREDDPKTQSQLTEKLWNIITDLCKEPRFNDTSPLPPFKLDTQQISKFCEVTAGHCPVSSMATFHKSSFATDYLPMLRNMATTEEERPKSKRRGRSYLQKIGLEERSRPLQRMFEKSVFDK